MGKHNDSILYAMLMCAIQQYNDMVEENSRYEEWLSARTRSPGELPYPPGNNGDYTGIPIKDIPQDVVWWALRPSNHHQGWVCRSASHLSSESNVHLFQYQPMYNSNKRMLDEVYKSCSPGSEPIWFGTRYRGLRLDQVYERKSFLRWCFDPQRGESGTVYRFFLSIITNSHTFCSSSSVDSRTWLNVLKSGDGYTPSAAALARGGGHLTSRVRLVRQSDHGMTHRAQRAKTKMMILIVLSSQIARRLDMNRTTLTNLWRTAMLTITTPGIPMSRVRRCPP